MNPTQKRALIVKMRGEGALLREIGEVVGMNKQRVWAILNEGKRRKRVTAPVQNPRCANGCGRGRAWGSPDELCARCRAGRPAPLTAREHAARASAMAAAANRRRSEAAAVRAVAGARERLASGRPVTEHQQRVLQARIDYPEWTLAQLGAHLGITKDSYATTLRKAIASTPVAERRAA